MPESRFIRYTLRGNYWVAPGRTPIPAPPFTVPPVVPPTSTQVTLDNPASKLDGTRVLK